MAVSSYNVHLISLVLFSSIPHHHFPFSCMKKLIQLLCLPLAHSVLYCTTCVLHPGSHLPQLSQHGPRPATTIQTTRGLWHETKPDPEIVLAGYCLIERDRHFLFPLEHAVFQNTPFQDHPPLPSCPAPPTHSGWLYRGIPCPEYSARVTPNSSHLDKNRHQQCGKIYILDIFTGLM